jgi:hypothetical protein
VNALPENSSGERVLLNIHVNSEEIVIKGGPLNHCSGNTRWEFNEYRARLFRLPGLMSLRLIVLLPHVLGPTAVGQAGKEGASKQEGLKVCMVGR